MHEMLVTNSVFQKKKRRLGSARAPQRRKSSEARSMPAKAAYSTATPKGDSPATSRMLSTLSACHPSTSASLSASAGSGSPLHASADPSELGWKKVRFAASTSGHVALWQSTTTTYQLCGNLPMMFMYESISPSSFSGTTTLAAISSQERLRIDISQNDGQEFFSSSKRNSVIGDVPGFRSTVNVILGSLFSGSASCSAVVGGTQKLPSNAAAFPKQDGFFSCNKVESVVG
mmetsp:Transcript_48147/g.100663  ORF Transcript_48147/g.100663 Transcript_48147/m.100663 type:complete len:231 (-) Transcript_48147:249-941(-)